MVHNIQMQLIKSTGFIKNTGKPIIHRSNRDSVTCDLDRKINGCYSSDIRASSDFIGDFISIK